MFFLTAVIAVSAPVARGDERPSASSRPATRASSAAAPAPATDPDLVGWWRAARVDGDAVIDLSGKGRLARPVAPSAKLNVEKSDGRSGIRLAPDGRGLAAGADAAFDVTADFTVALWARLANNAGDVTLLSKADRGGGGGGWAIVHGIRGIGGFGFVAAPGVFVPTPIKAADGWVHVAVTFREREFLLYVDGKPIGIRELELVPPPARAPLTFGASADGTGALDGWLDDVRIYHRALAAADVEALVAGREPENPYAALSADEEKRVRGLILDLGADSYERRERAGAALKAMGRRVYPLLREYRDWEDLEVASRAKALLGDVPAAGPSEGRK